MTAAPRVPERALPGSVDRRALLPVLFAPLVPTLIGSAFNILYNLTMTLPRLDAEQQEVFQRTVLVYNLGIYPIAIVGWAWAVLSLRRTFHELRRGEPVPPRRLALARRHLINLPWWGLALSAAGWL